MSWSQKCLTLPSQSRGSYLITDTILHALPEIRQFRLATGTWQGIWYLEFRASKHQRKVVATIQGEKM
ncbi:UPF0047 domain protein [Diplocarpon rosae]|nr:UPF0047 domain protein [Diplocarpon rosae]